MVNIGRIALGGAFLNVALAQTTCLPAGAQFDPNDPTYFCSGSAIVDASGNTYRIVNGRLVRNTVTQAPVTGCPAANRLQSGYTCAFNQYGYIEGPNGLLYTVNAAGTGLSTVTAAPGSAAPAGFTPINDGSGNLQGPGGARWQVGSAPNYVLSPALNNGESYACPLSRIESQGLFCDPERAPQYIIGENDKLYTRISESEIVPLTITGTTAPVGFTWTYDFTYTTIDGPRGFRWNIDSQGRLTKTNQDQVDVSDVCNNGRTLAPGFRCAGFGYDYILDTNDDYYFISAAGFLERLTVVSSGNGNYQAPPGFTVRSDGRTLEGPQGPTGTVYSVNANTLQLEVQEAADSFLAVCPAERLPPNYRCAEASPRYAGRGDGLYGYVIGTDLDTGDENYFVVQRGSTNGGDSLVPLKVANVNSIPEGFTTLINDIDDDEPTKFRGPDDAVNNIFEIDQDSLEFVAVDGNNEGEIQGNECGNVEDDLPDGYECAGGDGDDFNYVIGPEGNYFTLRDSKTLVRLRAVGPSYDYAPNGFTVVCVNDEGEETAAPCESEETVVLTAPVDSEITYTIGPDGRLTADNPNNVGAELSAIGCPAQQLPTSLGFLCPTNGQGFGYVLGCDDPREGCEDYEAVEFYFVDRTTNPARLVRLGVTDGQAPAGFEVLADQRTLRSPVNFVTHLEAVLNVADFDKAVAKVYVENANGFLQSQDAPETGPTMGYECSDWEGAGDLPDNFQCVNTQPAPPAWCDNAGLLTVRDEEACSDWEDAFSEGVDGGSYCPAKYGTCDASQEVQVEGGHLYLVSSVDHNIYIVQGANVVRLAVTELEAPPGFSFVAGSDNRLVGPDAATNALGWEYVILADGTLSAVGGTEPEPTIENDRCPQERLPDGYSCIEDYESENAFGFFIRNERTLNLYQLTADRRSLAQLAVGNSAQVAPFGFAFAGSTARFTGPLGNEYKRVAGKIVYDNALADDTINIPDDTAILTVGGVGCDGTVVNLDVQSYDSDGEESGAPNTNVEFDCVVLDGQTYLATGVAGTNTEDLVDALGNDVLPGDAGFPSKWKALVAEAGIDAFTITAVGSTGTPTNPQVPTGWPTEATEEGDYVDPNDNLYHFVYVSNSPRYSLGDDLDSNVRSYTAIVVYNDINGNEFV